MGIDGREPIDTGIRQCGAKARDGELGSISGLKRKGKSKREKREEGGWDG